MRKHLFTLSFIVLSISGKSQTPTARCPNPVKLNIADSANYFNLSGYLFPLRLLFDGNTSTMPVPTSGEKFSDYYHSSRGWRWDIDLRQHYYITNVKLYWGTSNADTARVWMSDSVFNGGPVAFARLRTINSTVWDVTSYSPGSAGWVDFVVDDSTRHIRIQAKNATFAGNPFPSDGIREAEIWGCRIGSPATIYALRRAQLPLPLKNGTNLAAEIHPVNQLAQMLWARTYPERDYADNENVAYPLNRIRYALFGGNPYIFNDSVKNILGVRYFWPAFLGSSQYLQSTHGKPMEFLALDEPTDDPEDPASYERAADFAWHIGHLWGDDEDAHLDTSYSKVYDYVSITGGPKPYANNTISGFEGDNERNGWWKFFGVKVSPISQIAKASAERDGDQGRLPDRLGGNRMGVKNADDSLLFIMPGTAGIDIEEVKAEMYLSKMLRGDCVYDVVQVHEYFTKYDGSVTFTSNGQINNRGTYPEDDSARYRYDEVVNWGNRIIGDTSVIYITGEHGKDATFRYPVDAAEVDATITQFGATRYVDGTALDSLQAQAIDIERDKIAIWASGLAAGVQYLYHDLEVQGVYGYAAAYVASGYITHGGTKKASWFRNFSQNVLLEGYVRDSIISEVNTGLIHYHGHKINEPDSMVDIIIMGDDTTGAGIAVNIDIGTATTYTLRQASYTSQNPASSSGSASGGTISATATIIPKYYFSYQPDEEEENQAPTAEAGSNQTITLPTSSVTVNGSSSTDPDGTISTYLWTKTDGPATYTIVSASSASTNITGLVAGTYEFTLTVTDNDGATDTDTVTITVHAAPAQTIKVKQRGRKRILN